jgi:hypothetical protein
MNSSFRLFEGRKNFFNCIYKSCKGFVRFNIRSAFNIILIFREVKEFFFTSKSINISINYAKIVLIIMMPGSVFQSTSIAPSASSPRVCISLGDQGGQVGSLAGLFEKEHLSPLGLPVKLKCFVVRFRWAPRASPWSLTSMPTYAPGRCSASARKRQGFGGSSAG